MKQMEQLTAKWNELQAKAAPHMEKAREGWRKTKHTWKIVKPWVWQFRKVLLAIPVLYLAFYLARLNWNVLPEMVGLNLQTNGEYAEYISRETAVYAPLGLTGGCLAMMFLTKKTLYPWMICMISMLLPLLILLINIFPS
jgi:hypothetical protein